MQTPKPPIKNTAGEGFAVEDRVAAWLACHLLSNTPWPNPQAGFIEAINCQMRQDSWHFDDFVVDLSLSGEAYRCACSVKSFPVLGVKGAPAEFTEAAWNEWLAKEESSFKRERDKLALFAAPHDSDIREAWLGMLDFGRSGVPPETVARRHAEGAEPSALKRDAFTSMACPLGVDATSARDATETARLLRSLYLQEQDFDHADSQSLKLALLLCQQALDESARSQAQQLWHEVLVFAAEIRNKGGRISMPNLLARLAPRFSLRQSPLFAVEWQRVIQDSHQQVSGLPTTIGGTHSVERQQLLDSISQKKSQKRVTLLVGESGNGKTVLATNWVIAGGSSNYVWLRASDLAVPGGISARWDLNHDLMTLFANAAKPMRLVIDGLDKCFDEAAFNDAAVLLKAALADDARDRWLVVLTCSHNDWERVHREFIRRGLHLDYNQISVARFSDDELREVCAKIPSLKPLWSRPHLRPILGWPKALDIAATHWRSSASPQWTSESDFARWFWSTAINHDQAFSLRDRVLRKLAGFIADRLSAKLNLSEFTHDETSTLLELARENHVIIEQQSQTVRFAHDLIGDWARLRELQVQANQVAGFLIARLHSPIWHRSLRFYALDMLEHSATAMEWQRLFDEFNTKDHVSEIARNLLLEAPIFALHQQAILERLWPSLIADDGALLRRFLRQFLRVATLPDERYVAMFKEKDPDLQLNAAVRYRLPWWPYWQGVLAFLADHQDEVIRHAREEIADSCLMWLPLHDITSMGMQAAAKLAVAAAKLLYRGGDRAHSHGHDISPEEKVCAALLAAAPILPDEVTAVALKLSGRRPPDPEDGLPAEEDEPVPSIFGPRYGPPQPWPEGPQVPCNPDFREAFMDLNWPAPFMVAIPETAAEVMFSVLLDIPRVGASPRDDWHHHRLDEHGFSSGRLRHESPFWTHGSFLTFLRVQPKVALSAIIRLVNFAADRCLEIGADIREPIEAPISVGGETRIWKGHRYSYLWHQGHVFGPRAVCCALLSLENWLYMLMDRGSSLEEPLSTILQESHSIALAAVLVCIGKRQPDLFLGTLRPLLASAELHWMEESIELRVEGGFRASMITDWSPSMREQIRGWVGMPHRKIILSRFALEKFFSDAKWREVITEIRSEWEARLGSATPENPAPEWLPRMVAQLDLNNWRAERHRKGMRISFEPPSNLPQPTPEEKERFEAYQKLVLLPFECSRILKGEIECPEAQMSDWWNQLTAIRKIQVPQDRDGFQNVEDALCGIVAIAIVRHREWLAASPDRETEAVKILDEVGQNPPSRFWFVEDDFCDYKWDYFSAWALTALWIESPEEPYLRQAVASFAVWDREIVVDRVLRIAAQRRSELGNHFEELLSHAIRYAPAKHRVFLEEHSPQRTFDISTWLEQHVTKFMNSQTDSLPSSWNEIAEPQPWRGGKTSGIDIGHIKATLGWAEDLSAAKDAAERIRWIELYHQALLCAVRRMQNQNDNDTSHNQPWEDQQDGFPYRDESGLLERVASVLARLNPGEPHRLLWEPVLALGAQAGHWIDSFVSHWLIEANRNDDVAPGFVEQWVAMLEYAENSPAWTGANRRSRSMRDSWLHLLGLSPFGSEFWRAELQPAVKAARPFFERWARRSVGSDYHARTYIHFLRTPAAEAMRLDGLCLLKDHVKMNDGYFWKREATQDAFAGLLRMMLDQHWPAVIDSAACRDAFMAFALKLTSLQHPLGSEVTNIASNRLGGIGQTA